MRHCAPTVVAAHTNHLVVDVKFNHVVRLNIVGMDRAQLPKDEKIYLKRAFKILFRSGLSLKTAIKRIVEEIPQSEAVTRLVEFLKKAERGICK